MTDQTYSLLWLWVLQVVWALATWLPLALVAILIALAIRWLHYRAKVIEAKKVESGFVGFLKITRDYIHHLTIGKAMFLSIIFGLALGGTIAVGLQKFIQPEVQGVIERKDFPRPDVEEFSGQHVSIDFIIFLALILGIFIIIISIRIYHMLKQRASEMAGELENHHSSRPLLVRLFHDSQKIGILVLAIGGFLFFGMLMQIVSLILILVPLPRLITGMSFPYATTAFIWILLAIGIALFLAFFVPSIWMGIRNFRLQLRYYHENRVFRTSVNVSTGVFVCLFGALLNMWLINYLGRFFWPEIFH